MNALIFQRLSSLQSPVFSCRRVIIDSILVDKPKGVRIFMKKIILTGDRPTGRLHIGHYVGSLSERVKLQNTGAFPMEKIRRGFISLQTLPRTL